MSLVLVGTPIGNLEDMSPRGVRALEEADVIACEDTRRTRKLLTHFGISGRELVVYNEANERDQAQRLVERVARGDRVALVSDAGMPGLADPGYRLVTACVDRQLAIEVVPGPSAAITALVVSGLPTDRFAYEGFLPRKRTDRKRRIAELADEPRTIVLFESPHRVIESLDDLLEGLGDRRAALARELTKLYEETMRATLRELRDAVAERGPRGEIVIVIEGAGAVAAAPTTAELADRARALMAEGVERRSALAQVARDAGVPKREVFDALLEDPAGD
jgi:16S rRNA (cytidine1402-2'-O)-methyltransferase